MLVFIICFFSLYYSWNIYSSIIMRDNMSYQEYNWSFNPNSISTTTTSSTSSSDPWLSNVSSITNTCIGENCCADGLIWDASLNQCTSSTTTTETFVTNTLTREAMVNNVLTKKEPNKYKYDYNMSPTIQGSLSKSFTNNAQI